MTFGSPLFLLIILLLIVKADSFRILKHGISSENGKKSPFIEGTTVILECQGSDSMEKCNWYHKSGNKEYLCKFDWTRKNGKKETKTYCSRSLTDRIKFVGNYDENKCFVKLSNIGTTDDGEWKCYLQEYVWGSILESILGGEDSAKLKLEIEKKENNGKTA